MVKPPLRTKTLSTKVSEEELAQLEAAASERGLTPSEWCRETLLASVNGQEPKAYDPGGTGHAVMAELVALRAILLNVTARDRKGTRLPCFDSPAVHYTHAPAADPAEDAVM